MGRVLVGAHNSSLWPPTQVRNVQIDSAHPPRLPSPDGPPALVSEHASFSTIFSFERVLDVLLRVLDGGRVVELTALYRPVEPIRFVFPSPVILKPALALWQDVQLRLIVLTQHGSLYRLAFPAHDKLWHSPRQLARWKQEYRIKTYPDQLVGPVHTLGCSIVVVGLRNADPLRLDAKQIGDAIQTDDEWSENAMSSGGLLGFTWTSYVPFHGSAHSFQLLSIESSSDLTDSELIFTLSRSMTIRVWAPRIGVVAQAEVSTFLPSRRAKSPATETGRNAWSGPHADGRLKLFSANDFSDSPEDSLRIVVFNPVDDTSDTSLGYFSILSLVQGKQISHIRTFHSPKDTSHAELIDISVHDGFLHALWHKEAGTSLKSISISAFLNLPDKELDAHWLSCGYPESDTILLPNLEIESYEDTESISARYLSFALRPDAFSIVTLQAALEHYCEALLSLPDPPSAVHQHYASVHENIAAVVGCSIQLAVDPESGLPRRTQYMSALKRDWESFIARCMDIERAARYPISLATSSYRGVVLLERERTAVVCEEDKPMILLQSLQSGKGSVDAIPLSLRHGYKIYQDISRHDPTVPVAASKHFLTFTTQDVAFAYSDVLRDASGEWMFDLNAAGLSYILQDHGVLSSLERRHLDAAVTSIASIETFVKPESQNSTDEYSFEWERCLVASLASASIKARYRLARILAVFLLFLGGTLKEAQNPPLAYFFSLYRGLALLDRVANTLTESDPPSPFPNSRPAEPQTTEHLPEGYPQASVGRNRAHLRGHQTALRCMVAIPERQTSLLDTTRATLAETGLLGAVSLPRNNTAELDFLITLQDLNLNGLLNECFSYLPQTAAVNYLAAQSLLSQCRPEYAARRFAVVAGYIGNLRLLPPGDREAFEHLFPCFDLPPTLFSYYSHVASLFDMAGHSEMVIDMCNLALGAASPSDDVEELWRKVVQYNADLGRFEDALMALIDCPLLRLRPGLIDYVVNSLCEAGASHVLITSSFTNLAAGIESSLQWKARNSDCLTPPSYSHILYARFFHTGDYRAAALAIFEHARRLGRITAKGELQQFIRTQQADAYLLAINALSLLDSKEAWIIVQNHPTASVEAVDDWDHGKRQTDEVTQHVLPRVVPPTLFAESTVDHDVVDISYLRRELLLIKARIDLVDVDPTLSLGNEALFSPIDVVLRYRDLGHFDRAFALADGLRLPIAPVLQSFLDLYIRLKRNPNADISPIGLSWLQSPRVASLTGTIIERAWRYLESVLLEYEKPGDYTYRKMALESLLKEGGSQFVPADLARSIWENEKEELIRLHLRHGDPLVASKLASSLLENEPRMKNQGVNWHPYSLTEQIIAQTPASGDESVRSNFLNYIDKSTTIRA